MIPKALRVMLISADHGAIRDWYSTDDPAYALQLLDMLGFGFFDRGPTGIRIFKSPFNEMALLIHDRVWDAAQDPTYDPNVSEYV